MDTSTFTTALNIVVAVLFSYVVLRHLPHYVDQLFDRLLPNVSKEWGYIGVLLITLSILAVLIASGLISYEADATQTQLLFTVGMPALIFTFQAWIRDAFAGIGLHLTQPMIIGEWIMASGQMGGVVRIGLFRTTIETLGLDTVSFRNSELSATAIYNLSTIPFYEVKTVIHTAGYADYGYDIRNYLADVEAIAVNVQEKVCPEAAAIDRYRSRAYLLGFGSSSDEITVISYATGYRGAVSEMHIAMAEALRPKGVVLGQVAAQTIDNLVSQG